MFVKFFDSPQTALLTYDICNVTRYDKQKLPDIFVRIYGKLSGSIHDRRTPDEHFIVVDKAWALYIVKGALDIDELYSGS